MKLRKLALTVISGLCAVSLANAEPAITDDANGMGLSDNSANSNNMELSDNATNSNNMGMNDNAPNTNTPANQTYAMNNSNVGSVQNTDMSPPSDNSASAAPSVEATPGDANATLNDDISADTATGDDDY